MSRLRAISTALLFTTSSSHITPAPETTLVPAGGPDALRSKLEELYWEGVRAELENIIRTLQAWQEPENAHTPIPVDKDDFIHGFDTFVDQVNQEAREYAIRQGNIPADKPWSPPQYEPSLREAAMDRKAEFVGTKIKTSVRRTIDTLPKLSGMEQQAWALLQLAGFLDIDKLIEHRPPLDKPGFDKRPAIPQLAPAEFDKLGIPKFQPLHCARPDCKSIIRSSMFVSRDPAQPSVVCEDCYRTHYYGKESYTKQYKHCALHDSISPERSRDLCHCKTVPHYDSTGKPLALFPIDKQADHLDVGGPGTIQCGLLKLDELVARAKYNGLQETVDVKENKLATMLSKEVDTVKADIKAQDAANSKKGKGTEKKKGANGPGESDPASPIVITEAEADTDIPLFFRRFARKHPFGDVHMALRVGPLVIENGVAHTKGGARVTVREMPVFLERFSLSNDVNSALVISGSERTLWTQARQAGHPKRYKAIMKQVVGAPFTGLLPQEDELDIVRDILAACEHPIKDKPNASEKAGHYLVPESLIQKVKKLLQFRLDVYLDSIAARLVDPKTTLTWSATKNNCLTFCNALLDPGLFAPLVSNPSSKTPPSPLYLMSFVCPDAGYLQPRIRTKHDVPSGHVEEYLLRLHFGRHDESDMIDTLHEYWHDWGAFTTYPLHTPEKPQSLFPWDCTPAHSAYPSLCGRDCNTAKHLWAFPFDAWSLLSLHLTRDRHLYPQPQPTIFHQSRLALLHASHTLTTAAAAMSLTPSFHSTTAWLHQPSSPLHRHPALTRVKLGGIHRAQPHSHYQDAPTHAQYFLAPWALLSEAEKWKKYSEARDTRIKAKEMPRVGQRRDWRRFYGGPTPQQRGKGDKKKGTGGNGGYAGFGGAGDQSWQWNVNLNMTVGWADPVGGDEVWDCGLTGEDVGSGKSGSGGAAGGGGPVCAVKYDPNCGSCSGSATACGGGDAGCGSSGGGCGGGGSSSGGGGGCGSGGGSGGGGGGGCGGGGCGGGGGC